MMMMMMTILDSCFPVLAILELCDELTAEFNPHFNSNN